MAKLIIYNIVLLFICHNKRSSSSNLVLEKDNSLKTTRGSFRVRSTNFLLNLRVTPPISMKFGTLADNA